MQTCKIILPDSRSKTLEKSCKCKKNSKRGFFVFDMWFANSSASYGVTKYPHPPVLLHNSDNMLIFTQYCTIHEEPSYKLDLIIANSA